MGAGGPEGRYVHRGRPHELFGLVFADRSRPAAASDRPWGAVDAVPGCAPRAATPAPGRPYSSWAGPRACSAHRVTVTGLTTLASWRRSSFSTRMRRAASGAKAPVARVGSSASYRQSRNRPHHRNLTAADLRTHRRVDKPGRLLLLVLDHISRLRTSNASASHSSASTTSLPPQFEQAAANAPVHLVPRRNSVEKPSDQQATAAEADSRSRPPRVMKPLGDHSEGLFVPPLRGDSLSKRPAGQW